MPTNIHNGNRSQVAKKIVNNPITRILLPLTNLVPRPKPKSNSAGGVGGADSQ